MGLPPRWRWKLERWRDSLLGVFRGKPQDSRPRLCPACGTLVGATAARCHECGASMKFSLAAASRSISSLLPTESPITYGLLLVNGLLFAVTWMATLRMGEGMNLMGGVDWAILYRFGGRQAVAIFSGDWWRLILPIFLHGGLLHFGMNSIILLDLGPPLEELYGSPRYFFLYLCAGIASFILSTAWSIWRLNPYGLSIGASGALMGLAGAMIAITTRRGGAYMQMVRGQLVRWVVILFVLGFLFPIVDNAAHFGGLAAGFLLGKVMEDREPMNARERKRAYVLGWLTALVVLLSFAAMFARNLGS